jgi:NDP-sugar pyrophosphorylase family protein
MTNDICIIIPVAGLGKRMKAYGPKASIRIDKEETVLSRQIKILRNFFPKSKIIVVCGFQKEKIFEIIDEDIVCVENKNCELKEQGKFVKVSLLNLPRPKLNKNTSKLFWYVICYEDFFVKLYFVTYTICVAVQTCIKRANS